MPVIRSTLLVSMVMSVRIILSQLHYLRFEVFDACLEFGNVRLDGDCVMGACGCVFVGTVHMMCTGNRERHEEGR